jgi:hypothetical protein
MGLQRMPRTTKDILPDLPDHLCEILAMYLFCRFLGFREAQIQCELEGQRFVFVLDTEPVLRFGFHLGMRSRRNLRPQLLDEVEVAKLAWRKRCRGLTRKAKAALLHEFVFSSKISASFPLFVAYLHSEGCGVPRMKDPEVESCVTAMLRISMSKLPPAMTYLSIVDREALALWTLLRVGGVPEDKLSIAVHELEGSRYLCLEIRWKKHWISLGVALVPAPIDTKAVLHDWRRNLDIYKDAGSEIRATMVAESRMPVDFPDKARKDIGDIVNMDRVRDYLCTVRGEQGIS